MPDLPDEGQSLTIERMFDSNDYRLFLVTAHLSEI